MAGPERAALTEEARSGRLTVRPPTEVAYAPQPAGEFPLGLAEGRDGLIIVPAGYRPETPTPLLIALHGASGSVQRVLYRLGDTVRGCGAIILIPESRWVTWDVLQGGYGPDPRLIGPDVAFLDRALEYVFGRYRIDPTHIALQGFSDGASYSLSLGLANGDLITHIIANSAGFIAPPIDRDGRVQQVGAPKIYISHGTTDEVLPIALCGRPYAYALSQIGYDVTYREFQGPHTIPPEVLVEMLAWWLGDYDPMGENLGRGGGSEPADRARSSDRDETAGRPEPTESA